MALWSLCPVPLTSMMFTGTLPIMAKPYVVPAVTVYGVCSWKSTHVNVVPMFTDLVWASSVPAVFVLAVYSAAIAFPVVVPSMYAMMSVIDPVDVAVKYEMD
jgi:hypothetical protein